MMPRNWGRLIWTASLASLLASASAGIAQAQHPWVDPPPEAGAQPQVPAVAPPAPKEPEGQKIAPASPSQAGAPQTAKKSEDAVGTAAPPSSSEPQQASAGKAQTEQKAAFKAKAGSASRQASTSTRRLRREEQVARRREPRALPGTEVSRAELQNSFAPRYAGPRFRSVQEGLDSGLEVMRLRTIQLPDGRRITVLTRPNREITSEMLEEAY